MAQIQLHVHQADGYLPAVCMCCGQEATVAVSKRMSWCPRWVGGVVALILTKYATVQAPFCDEHKGHWFKRGLLMWGSLFLFFPLGIGGLIIAGNLEDRTRDTVMPIVALLCVALFIAWIVTAIVCQYTAIRPTHISDEEIWLTGVSEQFVDAVDEEEAERRRRRTERRRERSRWRNEVDDDDDYDRPRRRRGY